jgi:hypothetical protein
MRMHGALECTFVVHLDGECGILVQIRPAGACAALQMRLSGWHAFCSFLANSQSGQSAGLGKLTLFREDAQS